MTITPWVPLNPAVDDGVTLSNKLNVKIPELEAAIAAGGSNDFDGTVTITDPNTPRLELHQPDLSTVGFRASISATEAILEAFGRPVHYRIDGNSRWIIEQNRLQGRVQTLDLLNSVADNAGDVTLGFQNFNGTDRVRFYAQPAGGFLIANAGTVRMTIASDGTIFTGALNSSGIVHAVGLNSTGDVNVTKAYPILNLDATAVDDNDFSSPRIMGKRNGRALWQILMGEYGNIWGGDAARYGAAFALYSYDNAGANPMTVMSITRHDSQVNFGGHVVAIERSAVRSLGPTTPTSLAFMDNANASRGTIDASDAGDITLTPVGEARVTKAPTTAFGIVNKGYVDGLVGAGGSAWKTVQVLRIPPGTSPVLIIPAGYEAFRMSFLNMETTVNQEMFWRASLDNGATYLSGATDYFTQGALWQQSAGSAVWANRSYAGLSAGLIPPNFPTVVDAIFLPGSATRQCVMSTQQSGWTWTTGAAQSTAIMTNTLNRNGRVTNLQISVVGGNYQAGTIIVEGLPNAAPLAGALPAAPLVSGPPPITSAPPLTEEQKIHFATANDTAALEARIAALEESLARLGRKK